MREIFGLALAVVASLALAGCVSVNTNVGTPPCQDSGHTGVSNQADSFDYGGVACSRTSTETYTWSNSRPTAAIQWGGISNAGSLSLDIKDAVGHSVYSSSVGGNGTSGQSTTSAAGIPGSWTITLTFSSFTGTMGLHVSRGS